MPTVRKLPVLASMAKIDMSFESRLPTYAKCPEASVVIRRGRVPPVGTVSLGLSRPVAGSTTKVEMSFDCEFTTKAKRGAAEGGWVGVFDEPQPVITSIEKMKLT